MRIILWIAVAVFSWGDVTRAASAWRDTVTTDGQRMGLMVEKLGTSPLRASTREWVGAGAVVAGVALSALADNVVEREAVHWDEPWHETVSDIGHTFQRTDVFLGTLAAAYVGGLATNEPRLRRIGQEIAVAFTIAAIGTQLMKNLTGRARPDQERGSGYFIGPNIDDNFQSLWSGDVTKAFVLASVISEEAKHPAVTIVLYGLASATAFQRIQTDRHWLSDVLSAAVWSTAVGIGTVRMSRHVQVMPNGIAVTW